MQRIEIPRYRPRAYVPRGKRGAEHWPAGLSRITVLGGKGPDGGPDGGTCIGGPMRDDEPGWEQVGEYWVNLRGCAPHQVARLNLLAGNVLEVPAPDGSPDDAQTHRWVVPHLLQQSPAGGWQSALDPVLTPQGWREPEAYSPVMHQVRETIEDFERLCGPGEDVPADLPDEFLAAATAAALAVLGLHYWVTPAELTASRWISQSLVFRVLQMAVRDAQTDADGDLW